MMALCVCLLMLATDVTRQNKSIDMNRTSFWCELQFQFCTNQPTKQKKQQSKARSYRVKIWVYWCYRSCGKTSFFINLLAKEE